MNLQLEDEGLAISTAPFPASSAGEASPQAAALLYRPSEVHLLVVDDDAAICTLLHRVLAQPNFAVDTVSQPNEIEATLRAKPYDLILLDYTIPGLQPNAIFEWMRRDQTKASVIVVTGYPSVDSAISCLRARTYDYLTKPLDLSRLRQVVRRCLESKGLLRLSEVALRESLGGAIRERRKTLGLTLAQMAERAHLSLGYLSQIELGKNSASIETLYRICLSLGIKMAELFQVVHS